MDRLNKILSQISPDSWGSEFCCRRGPGGGYQDSTCLCSKLPCDSACHNSCFNTTRFTYPERMCSCGEKGSDIPRQCCKLAADLYLYIRRKCQRQLDRAINNPCDSDICQNLSDCHARTVREDPAYRRLEAAVIRCISGG